MIEFRRTVERILSQADVRVNTVDAVVRANTQRPLDICVKDSRFFRKALTGGSIGFGEAYMDGCYQQLATNWWHRLQRGFSLWKPFAAARKVLGSLLLKPQFQ